LDPSAKFQANSTKSKFTRFSCTNYAFIAVDLKNKIFACAHKRRSTAQACS